MRDDNPNRRQRALERRAAEQEGLLRRADLLELGLGRKAIPYRVQSGRLFRLHPGIYALGPGPHPRRTTWLAALWWCGAGSALSYFSAGAFHGHGPEPDVGVVHVTTRNEPGTTAGVVVHRTRHLHRLDWSQHGLLAVTNRSRTLVDEASLLPFPAFRARADRLRDLPLRELEATIRRAPRRQGSAAARRLLQGDQRHTRSVLERRFLRLCRDTGLPAPPHRNVPLAGHTVDCLYPSARLAVELDGRAYHERRAQMQADRLRDADYQLAGFRILRLTWWDLEPEWAPRTTATLRAFLVG